MAKEQQLSLTACLFACLLIFAFFFFFFLRGKYGHELALCEDKKVSYESIILWS